MRRHISAARSSSLRKGGLKTHLIVLTAYIFLTLLMTYPLLTHFTTHVPGDGGDAPMFAWNLWWAKRAIIDLHTNPLRTSQIFYPFTVSLVFHTLVLLNGILAIPFQLLFGLITAYNVVWALTFVLTAYGTYLLAEYVLNNRAVAFTAGVIFAFCPIRFGMALGLLNLLSTQLIPFYVLFLLKTGRESGARNPLLAGLFLALQAWNDYLLLSYLIIFTAIFLVYNLLYERERTLNFGFAMRLAILGGVFLLVAFPLLYSIATEILSKGNYIGTWPLTVSNDWAPDLLLFIFPPPLQAFFRYHPINLPCLKIWTERFVSVGYVVIFLSLFAGLRIRERARFWIMSATTFFLLSLGPSLHVGGRYIFRVDELDILIPLPYILLHYIPFLNASRFPARYAIMLMFSLAILSGYALGDIAATIRKRWPWKRVPFVVASLTLLPILFEYAMIPYPMDSMEVPQVYTDISKVEGDFTVLQIPSIGWDPLRRMEYYQSVHQKRILRAKLARTDPDVMWYFHARDLPVLTTLANLELGGEEVTPVRIDYDAEVSNQVAEFFDIRYIVFHKAYFEPETASEIDAYLNAAFNVERIYDEDDIIAYEVKRKNEDVLLQIDTATTLARMYLIAGFSTNNERENQLSFVWATGTESTIFVPLSKVSDRVLNFHARPFACGEAPRQGIKVYMNDRLAGEVELECSWKEYQVRFLPSMILPRMNTIKFVYRYAGPPQDYPADYHIGHTGVTSPVDITLSSAGYEQGNYADIYVNRNNYSWDKAGKGYAVGYTIVTINPKNGEVQQWEYFNTTKPEEMARMAHFISSLPEGQIVALAVQDDGSTNLTEEGVQALRSLGAKIDMRDKFRWAYALIGVKGASPGEALEEAADHPLSITVGRDQRNLSVAFDYIQIWDKEEFERSH